MLYPAFIAHDDSFCSDKGSEDGKASTEIQRK